MAIAMRASEDGDANDVKFVGEHGLHRRCRRKLLSGLFQARRFWPVVSRRCRVVGRKLSILQNCQPLTFL